MHIKHYHLKKNEWLVARKSHFIDWKLFGMQTDFLDQLNFV